MSFSHHKCEKTANLENSQNADEKKINFEISEKKSKSNSKKILERKQTANLMQIFQVMDEKNLGFLSSENLNTKGLPENILTLYLSMISELHDFKETIDCEEFILISENILRVKFFMT